MIKIYLKFKAPLIGFLTNRSAIVHYNVNVKMRSLLHVINVM